MWWNYFGYDHNQTPRSWLHIILYGIILLYMYTHRGQCHHLRYAGTLHVALKNHLHGTWTDISTRNSPEDPSEPSILWHGYQWRFDFFSEIGGIVEDEVYKSNRFAWRFSHPEAIIGDIPIPFFCLIGLPLRSGFGHIENKKQVTRSNHRLSYNTPLNFEAYLHQSPGKADYNLHRSQSRVKTVKCWGGGHPAGARLECVWQTLGSGKTRFSKIAEIGESEVITYVRYAMG